MWDLTETAKGGPFTEVVESDIFINCIFLTSKIRNFVDMKSLNTPDRKLKGGPGLSVIYYRAWCPEKRVKHSARIYCQVSCT
jgi:hypothetical protein